MKKLSQLLIISFLVVSLTSVALAVGSDIKAGLTYYNQGKLTKAKTRFKGALKSPGDKIEAYSNLGLIAKEEGNIDNAIKYYRKALSLDGSLAANHISLGDLYLSNDNYEAAITEYIIADGLTSHFITDQKLGIVNYKQGNYEKALEYLENVVKDYKGVYPSSYYLGATYRKLGKNHKAEKYLKEAIQLNPTYVRAYLGLGDLYMDTGQKILGLKSYKKATKINPTYYMSHFKLAYAYMELNRVEQAKDSLEKTLHLKANFTKAREILNKLKSM
ncbi:tetratricopeptide repeat protein [Selenihalanaerobacter shriftii]|uniref:Tetratricopeptide repeat-containing protein n=1 Tax=Selenihalanaerobacter shriftii TaxID=142842 RepID=A0A1T4KH92_9FIRM|nr:tetratricopeptide repeat protein [Selenihalanaerobacter shriftii]SJZ41781.1 Tetratricopeptide repeat-containing protein [Selenihalanaerobacter shriftii]